MELLSTIVHKIESAGTFAEKTQAVVETLYREAEHYSWVGIYLVEGTQLSLAAWAGPQATEHTAIPIGEGICGLAVREGRTVNIPDVDADPNYLACFPQTRSEVVVPIRHGETIVGEIDIDGDQENAFTEKDIAFLEQVAGRLGEAWEA